MTTIKTALNWATKLLKKTSSSPALDAEVLLCHALTPSAFLPLTKGEIERGWLYVNPDYELSKLEIAKYRNLIAKRSRRWPIAYLTGHKEFYNLDFLVSPDVLIPRPETELLVEQASSLLTSSPPSGGEESKVRGWNIIDIGTGSGNIIVSLAVILSRQKAAKNLNFFAVDYSKKALQIAKQNAHRHGVAKRIKFLHGNLLDPLSPIFSPLIRGRLRGGRILILANLPYLKSNQYYSNPDLRHEPRSALVAGPDGLKYFRQLFQQLQKKFPPARGGAAAEGGEGVGGEKSNLILLEHDPSQKPALTNLAKKYFFKAQIRFHKDLANKHRVMEIDLT